jgi:pentatricopeptide repeat protein
MRRDWRVPARVRAPIPDLRASLRNWEVQLLPPSPRRRCDIQTEALQTGIHRCLASCYAHMGRLDEARDIVQRLRAITPTVMPYARPWRNPEHWEFFLAGLRLAAGIGIEVIGQAANSRS